MTTAHDPPIDVKGIRERLGSIKGALTADEVAELFGVSTQLIRREARLGNIPSFRISTAVRFDPKELCEWYEKH